MNLLVRTFSEICSELAKSHLQREDVTKLLKRYPKLLPPVYVETLKRIGSCEIAGDFCFLSPSEVIVETEEREAPLCELGKEWLVFGTSGTGDGWLLRPCKKGGAEVAFLDHDEESDAVPYQMSIALEMWFQVADICRQVEQAMDEDTSLTNEDYTLVPAARKQFVKALESVSNGLTRRWPYRF